VHEHQADRVESALEIAQIVGHRADVVGDLDTAPTGHGQRLVAAHGAGVEGVDHPSRRRRPDRVPALPLGWHEQ
jgi:hypothetical protein